MKSPRGVIVCVIALMAFHAAWLAWSATWQSPTLNEPGHLASGIAHWKLGRFEPYAVNPPLVRMVAAIPILLTDHQTDWSALRGRPGERAEFLLGTDFIRVNGDRSQRLFELARWGCIPFSLIGAWMCFIWGRALYGPWAGVLACGLWCVEPNIIGHGQLITPDVAATSLGLVSLWTFWQWLKQPGWITAIVAGVGLGAAVLAKFSWLMLFGIWPVIWLWALLRSPASPKKPGFLGRGLVQLAAMVVTAVYVINLAYTFDGSFSRLDSFQFTSEALSGQTEPGRTGNRFTGSWIGRLPVPVPRQMLLGLDLQKQDFEHFPHQSYLRGEWRQGGWWYYYLYAAAVKLPVGLWLLGLTALILRWRRTGMFEQTLGETVLLIPAIALFVVVSSELEFNHHFRYVLPCLGPIFVVASGSIVGAGRLLATWIAANFAWIAISSSIAAPCSLSYFNELAGGMRNGGSHLLHSNIDWGQDLVSLNEWAKANSDTKPLFLAYYGFYDPVAYGMAADVAPQGPFWETRLRDWSFTPGWYAVSVNYLHGTEWRLQNRHAYQPLIMQTPVTWCGGSIAVYRVDEELAKQLTEAVIAGSQTK